MMRRLNWDNNKIQKVSPRIGTKKDTFDFRREFIGAGKQTDIWKIENYIGSFPELFRYGKDGKFEICTIENKDEKKLDCSSKSFTDSVKYLNGESDPYVFNKIKVFPLVVDSQEYSSFYMKETITLDSSNPTEITVPDNTLLRINIDENVRKIDLYLSNAYTSRVIFHGSAGQFLNISVKTAERNHPTRLVPLSGRRYGPFGSEINRTVNTVFSDGDSNSVITIALPECYEINLVGVSATVYAVSGFTSGDTPVTFADQ